MEKFIVYKTTNLVNNMIYIGVHKTNKSEFDGYIGCGLQKFTCTSHDYHPTTRFHYAVKKYGKDNFIRETLYTFDTSAEAYNKEIEIVNEDFLLRKDVYNTSLGGNATTGARKRLYQFTLDGKLVKSWPGGYAVLSHYNLTADYTQLYSHLKGKYEWKGYFWSYSKLIKLEEFSFNKKSPGIKTEIAQYTLDGTLVKIWDSVTTLRRAGFSNVSGVLKGIRNQCKGFVFKYYKEDDDIVSSAMKVAAAGAPASNE